MLLILCFWELTSHKLEKVAEWLAALSAGAAQSSLEFGALIDSVCSPNRSSRPQMVSSASQRLHVIVTPHLSILKSTASPPLYYLKVSQQLGADLPEQQCVTADRYTDRQADMRLGLAALVCLFSSVLLSDCAPPTCYSRAVSLSKEVMTLLDKIHTYHRTVRAQPHSRSPRWPSETDAVCSLMTVLCRVAENVCWDSTYDLPRCACK